MNKFEKEAVAFVENVEQSLCEKFKSIDKLALENQKKVLDAFVKNRISARHFAGSNGYGYDDVGRDALNNVFADVFEAESAIASPLIVSGTHALTLALFGILRPGDRFLSVTGAIYDTLKDVVEGECNGSLKDFGIFFDQIELSGGKIDVNNVCEYIKKFQPKMLYLQRSRGYEWRSAIGMSDFQYAIREFKLVAPNILIVVDNCYGEFVDSHEPTYCGADLIVGSLIKNAGGGLAPTGGYIAGRRDLIDLVARRLTTPSTGNEVGSFEGGYRIFFQGLFMAPHTVSQAMKGAFLVAKCLSDLGFETLPSIETEESGDIICSIKFGIKQKLIDFCKVVQTSSPVDGYVTPEPWAMPGYENPVIMAAGCFVQGASIELSCDAPIREPFVAYLQGGLTYEHVKLTAIKAVQGLLATEERK